MKAKQRILVFHLLNDRSGSPKILSQILRSWALNNWDVILFTSLHQDGFLSDISNIHYVNTWYRFKSNPWLRLCFYSWSQLMLFFKLLFVIRKSDLVYINTVLPFGAALAGKFKGARVIYHIHEHSLSPRILKWFLFKLVAITASDIINVSNFVAQSHGIIKPINHLVYNAIDEDFLQKRIPRNGSVHPKNVLMVCSLKAYKGVYEFIKLAQILPQYQFQLVLNASLPEINLYFKGVNFPENIKLFSSQKNLHPFFQWADVILNLSRPKEWIETFGLTIIEGMAYALPAIVPPVGGVLEVIEDGVSGFAVDSEKEDVLAEKLKILLETPDLYRLFSASALKRVHIFQEKTMIEKINSIVLKE